LLESAPAFIANPGQFAALYRAWTGARSPPAVRPVTV